MEDRSFGGVVIREGSNFVEGISFSFKVISTKFCKAEFWVVFFNIRVAKKVINFVINKLIVFSGSLKVVLICFLRPLR